jgi:uncharacterized protein
MISAIRILLAVYFGFGAYLYTIQERFFYYPVEKINTEVDEVIFENEGEKIRVTVLNRGQKKALIYFGGNAEAVDYNAAAFNEYFPLHTSYLVKYRGYGGSTGKPSEQGFYSDALVIADKLAEQHSEISVIGRSLGSAVATYLAANRPIHKLVLVTPFDSAKSVAQSMWPLYPMTLLLKEKYDSLARVDQISAQTLLIVAGKDEVIAMANSKRLADGFGARAGFHVITEADHNNLSAYPEYHELLKQFLEITLAEESESESESEIEIENKDLH